MTAPSGRWVPGRIPRRTARRRLARLTAEAPVAGRPAGAVNASAGQASVVNARWSGLMVRHPRSVAVVAGLAAGAGTALGMGPVAGLFAAVYGGAVVRAWVRRSQAARSAAALALALDAVGALAADLRAGIPTAEALAEAVQTLAPGAPLQERLDVTVDARLGAVADGGRDALVARAAGLVVTAWRVFPLCAGSSTLASNSVST